MMRMRLHRSGVHNFLRFHTCARVAVFTLSYAIHMMVSSFRTLLNKTVSVVISCFAGGGGQYGLEQSRAWTRTRGMWFS